MSNFFVSSGETYNSGGELHLEERYQMSPWFLETLAIIEQMQARDSEEQQTPQSELEAMMSEFRCGECGSCLGRYADTRCQKEPVAVVREEIWALWRHMQAVGHHTEENPHRRLVLAAMYDEIQKLAERAGVLSA